MDRLMVTFHDFATLTTPTTSTPTPSPAPTSSPSASARWNQTAELVLRAQTGDREAFGTLIEQFQPTVRAICMRRLGHPSEAAELTQEIFLHVMTRLDQLREPERFAGWLRQVAVRMAINRATRRVPPPSVDEEILENASGRREEPLDELIAQERASRLWEGLERLRPMDREALVAFYIQGQSLAEIAEQMTIPLGTIKRRLHTARKRLKSLLEAGVADANEWTDHPNEEVEPNFALAAAC